MVLRKQNKSPNPIAAATPPGKAKKKRRSKLAGVERPRVLSGELKGPSLRARIAKNVYRIRSELNLSQDEMGKRTGIAGAFIGAIERGDQNITVDTLSNLAVAWRARRAFPARAAGETIWICPDATLSEGNSK